MSTKSAQVDRLIREHLTLNEGLNAQASQSQPHESFGKIEGPSGGEASAAQKLGEASNARVTEIRQELVQILQSAPADKI